MLVSVDVVREQCVNTVVVLAVCAALLNVAFFVCLVWRRRFRVIEGALFGGTVTCAMFAACILFGASALLPAYPRGGMMELSVALQVAPVGAAIAAHHAAGAAAEGVRAAGAAPAAVFANVAAAAASLVQNPVAVFTNTVEVVGAFYDGMVACTFGGVCGPA
jgi:hypothetical protein